MAAKLGVVHAQTSIWCACCCRVSHVVLVPHHKKNNNLVWHSTAVQAAESASALGEKHETNLFVDGGKGVKVLIENWSNAHDELSI